MIACVSPEENLVKILCDVYYALFSSKNYSNIFILILLFHSKCIREVRCGLEFFFFISNIWIYSYIWNDLTQMYERQVLTWTKYYSELCISFEKAVTPEKLQQIRNCFDCILSNIITEGGVETAAPMT